MAQLLARRVPRGLPGLGAPDLTGWVQVPEHTYRYIPAHRSCKRSALGTKDNSILEEGLTYRLAYKSMRGFRRRAKEAGQTPMYLCREVEMASSQEDCCAIPRLPPPRIRCPR